MAAPVVDSDYLMEIERARRSLRPFISFHNCAPILLRLAWHDAGTFDVNTKTGGPNGSIRHVEECTHSSNAGLEIAIDLLGMLLFFIMEQHIKFAHVKFTFCLILFFINLAGVVAVEVSGGPTIDFVPGRWKSLASYLSYRGGNLAKLSVHLLDASLSSRTPELFLWF
ncbi:putative L-ascorbate peroxidase 4 [Canna indica]|uniref:L-ascorbate peroxidase 4 n=1 Tax=Canna indica TaxID=4628 RepID=A0AAQ3QPM0_9LILI|nr:putative L-ascorbate peroxidase 4 [Canna indica]